ncbi:hypothetical protein D3C80_1159970 [compost metagenome]
MADEAVHILDVQPLRSQHFIDRQTQVVLGERRDRPVENDAESGVSDPPAHDVQRVGPGVFRRPFDAGEPALACPQHTGRRAVAEQGRGHDVGLAEVIHTERQGAELDHDQQDHAARRRPRQLAGQPQARRPARAAQAEDRNARGVGAKPHPLHGPRLQAGRGDAGRGDGDDGVHLAPHQARIIQRPLRRLDEQIDSDVQIDFRPFGPAARLQKPFDGHGGLARVDARRAEHRRHPIETGETVLKQRARGGGDLVLTQDVRRRRRGQGQQGDGRRHYSTTAVPFMPKAECMKWVQ